VAGEDSRDSEQNEKLVEEKKGKIRCLTNRQRKQQFSGQSSHRHGNVQRQILSFHRNLQSYGTMLGEREMRSRWIDQLSGNFQEQV
jgi:hypothetical protein